ncbi:MAG: enoyl-CoA hydratase-related protein [Chloroflexota bacterium]
MSDSVVLTEIHGKAGLIRLNRPKQRNALNGHVMGLVVAAAEAFDADPNIGAIVITGDDAAFAAGADIAEMANATVVDMLTNGRIELWDRLKKTKKPSIAAVSGFCLGGGCELAMSCDMMIASETAQFGQPEINIGVIPGAGGTQRMTRAVGKALAMEIVLNNRWLSAKEALQYGLVNRVVPVESYLAAALELANQIAARAPLAVRIGKEMVNQAAETFLSDGLAEERRAFYVLFSTEDQKEGMKAFVEKRKPTWAGK